MTCFAEANVRALDCAYHLGSSGYVTTVASPVTIEEFLRKNGIGQTPSEAEQALHQCPPIVRAAIAAHMRWWFFARSNSVVVRTFAHAVMAALAYAHCPILQVLHQGPGQRGRVMVVRGNERSRIFRCLPYRVLHFFGKFLPEASATGMNANEMSRKEWPERLRCNPTARSQRYGNHDDLPGCVAHVYELDYEHLMANGGLVRSTKGRMDAFVEAVAPAMQPFLSTEFVSHIASDEDRSLFSEYGSTLLAPKTFIERPRSKASRSMISRSLAYGMEQLAEELPFAMRWLNGNSDYQEYVQSEAKAYRTNREEQAMQAMAARDNASDWLHHFDTLAAVHYALPTVEAKNVPMNTNRWNEPRFAHNATLSFPGISQKRWI